MKAYLVDPFKRTIEEVEHTGSLESIYSLIDCDCFTIAAFDNKGNGAFVDDNGLFKEGQEFFLMDNYPQPLAGKGLILGCDEMGETIEPTVSIDKVRASIRFLSAAQIRGWYAQFQ